jgi:hypothetical protein
MEVETLHGDLSLGMGVTPMFFDETLDVLVNPLESPLFGMYCHGSHLLMSYTVQRCRFSSNSTTAQLGPSTFEYQPFTDEGAYDFSPETGDTMDFQTLPASLPQNQNQVIVLCNLFSKSFQPVENSRYTLEISGLPDKTRVETQMKMYIRLRDNKGNKVTKFPCLRLQDTLIAERRRKRKKNLSIFLQYKQTRRRRRNKRNSSKWHKRKRS